MKLLQSDGKPAAPAAVEAAYKRLVKDREIRANLDAIRKAGGTVEYRSLDVRDAAAFGALIDELNAAGGHRGRHPRGGRDRGQAAPRQDARSRSTACSARRLTAR